MRQACAAYILAFQLLALIKKTAELTLAQSEAKIPVALCQLKTLRPVQYCCILFGVTGKFFRRARRVQKVDRQSLNKKAARRLPFC